MSVEHEKLGASPKSGIIDLCRHVIIYDPLSVRSLITAHIMFPEIRSLFCKNCRDEIEKTRII